MSTVSRLEKLEAMLSSQPDDQLLRYMLAMEQDKHGRSEDSLAHMRRLMADPVPYVPAFLMAGQSLARSGRIEEARGCYSAGIQQAKQQGNAHAEGEMGQFLLALDQPV